MDGKTIPVIAFKNKSKNIHYLAANMDVGDWEDPDLDVTIDNIQNGFLIWRDDLNIPTKQDFEQVKAESRAHKEFMIKKFGKDACVSYDIEKWLKCYEPVHIEITEQQYEYARDLAFM